MNTSKQGRLFAQLLIGNHAVTIAQDFLALQTYSLKTDLWNLKNTDAWEMCSPNVNYTSAHARRTVLQMLVQSLEQAVRKKEHFVLHQMVEHQNPTRLYVLQSLIKETRSKLPIDKWLTKKEMTKLLNWISKWKMKINVSLRFLKTF